MWFYLNDKVSGLVGLFPRVFIVVPTKSLLLGIVMWGVEIFIVSGSVY